MSCDEYLVDEGRDCGAPATETVTIRIDDRIAYVVHKCERHARRFHKGVDGYDIEAVPV